MNIPIVVLDMPVWAAVALVLAVLATFASYWFARDETDDLIEDLQRTEESQDTWLEALAVQAQRTEYWLAELAWTLGYEFVEPVDDDSPTAEAERDTEPATHPMRVPSRRDDLPDTEESHAVIVGGARVRATTRVDDVELAHTLAEMHDRIFEWRKNRGVA